MLLFSEGQMGEDLKPFQKGIPFSKAGLKCPSKFALKKVTN
jgi:hypothetical protein